MNTAGASSAVDTALNRVFFLSQNFSNVTSQTISSFYATKFLPAATLELSALPGNAFDLRRWGKDGLALRIGMVTGRRTRWTSTLMGLPRTFEERSSEDLSSPACRLGLTCTSSVSVCARREGMSNELAVTPMAIKTDSKRAER
jgi:hypothetical protein